MSSREQANEERPGFGEVARTDWPLWVIVGAAALTTAVIYPSLPAEMPIHWNASGEVDKTAAKWWGAWVLLVTAVGTWGIVAGALHLTPGDEPFGGDVELGRLLRSMTSIFLVAIHGAVIAYALGYEFSMTDFALVGSGMLCAALGNFLGKVEPNWAVGIRVPWTLRSDEVWYRTHRFAAPLWVVGGGSMVFVPFIGSPVGKLVYFMTIVAVICIVPTIAAYRWYQEIEEA